MRASVIEAAPKPSAGSLSRPASAPARGEVAAIAAISAIALLLRVTSLSRSLFSDEAYTLAVAQRSFGHMIGLFGWEANGTPYSIVLWPLIRLFGDGEAVLRAPAVAAGVASVPALWWASRRYGRAVALIAAALLALNPMAVFYGQQARAYAFVIFAGCLAFGLLQRALDRGTARGWWAGYVLAMAALAYSEILAAPLVLPAQALLVRRADRSARRRWLWSLLAVLACCVPLLVAAAIEHSRRNALYWLSRPDRALVVLALQEFTAGFSEWTAVRWLTLAAGTALVVAAAWSLRGRAAGEQRSAFAVALAWGVLPGALLLAVSFITPLFYPRYAIVALPGLCLLVALAAVRLWSVRPGALLAGCCVAAIAAAALAADVHQRSAVQEDWPPAAAWLSERAPGQPVLLDTVTVLPVLGYYDPAFRSAGGDLVAQEWHDRPLPAGLIAFKDRGGFGTVTVGPPSAAAFQAAAARGGGSAWMVIAEADHELQGDPRYGAAAAWARAHCRVLVRESFGVWVLRARGCRAGP